MIRDQDDYDLYAHLIATAPLRAGLIRDGSDWPLCSAYKRRMRFNASIRTTDQVPSGPNQAIAANATELCQRNVLICAALTGFRFNALAVRKEQRAAVIE